MKISKVNHTRTGFSVSDENTQNEGVLYDNPSKKGQDSAKRDLKKHIDDCNRKAKGLYNVLNPEIAFTPDKDVVTVLKKAVREFNSFIKKAIDNNPSAKQTLVDAEVSYIREAKTFDSKAISTVKTKNGTRTINIGDYVDQLTMNNLRKSLKKRLKINEEQYSESSDIVAKLFQAYICGDNSASKLQDFNDDELRALFHLINKDYYKEEQLLQIQNSIEQQCVKVKVTEKDGKILIVPSNAYHPKKKYIFDFMTAFSASATEEREKLLLFIQNLIRLYLVGEGSSDTLGFEDIAGKPQFFCEKAYELSKERQKLLKQISEKREEIKALRTEKNDLATDLRKKGLKPDEKTALSEKLKNVKERIKSVECEENTMKICENRIVSSIKHLLADEIASRYRSSIKAIGVESKADGFAKAEVFWIDFIERTVEKIVITTNKNLMPYKLQIGYLCGHVWKEWTAFIAEKFVDYGKAIYHFALPDLSGVTEGKEVTICEVLPEFRTGISSFEYERIKAKESLEREISEYMSFAIDNFARACISDELRSQDKYEDVLQLESDGFDLYPDTDRRLLQFFGGKRAFEDAESEVTLFSGEDLFNGFRNDLNLIRNATFHYTGSFENPEKVEEVSSMLFEVESAQTGDIYRKKYYSNNVPMFYETEIIRAFMDRLYSSEKDRPAQIPSFNKVISRTAVSEFLSKLIFGKNLKKMLADKDVAELFRSSVYFILKEVYYYDFLQNEEELKKLFFASVDKMQQEEKDKHKQEAVADFVKRLDDIGRERSFGEICQGLMIEYMIQNTRDPRVKAQTRGSIKNDRDNVNSSNSYKHFRTLLYLAIKDAFFTYLKNDENEWKNLRQPVYSKERFAQIKEEEFLSGWKAGTFKNLADIISGNTELAAWYSVAHFMNPKQLNHLIGSIRSYLQFAGDIDRRADSLNNRVNASLTEEEERLKKILRILEFVMLFCGNTSKVVEDYFADGQEYADFLSHFVEYGLSKHVSDKETALHIFCDKQVGSDHTDGKMHLYHDGKEIIANKNIFLARMYGNTRILENAMQRISEKEIREYYKLKKKLGDVFKTGNCISAEQQIEYRTFQNLKNRIELVDIQIYTEFINELQSQLISWSYLRERDLMYFQLGFYYTKLFWTDTVDPEHHFRKLCSNHVNIQDGAILYQIAAMNTFCLKIIECSKKGIKPVSGRGSNAGAAVGQFVSKYCGGDESVYLAGLELFENTNEHDSIVKTRNYIDHFKYFAKADRSMLNLYSEVYDRFFRYDPKLRKSVSFTLPNATKRFFVDMRMSWELDHKSVAGKTHNSVSISIPENAMRSTYMTYKVPDDKEPNSKKDILVPARSDIFIDQMQKILEYHC